MQIKKRSKLRLDKDEFGMILVSIILVVGIFLLVYNISPSLLGFAVSDGDVLTNEANLDEGVTFTREDALQAINESEGIIKDMKESGFAGEYVDDLLLDANRILQQVDYAEIVRENVNATKTEKEEAREVLKLVDWEGVGYEDVLTYTEGIKESRELAFFVTDLISIQESILGAKRDSSGEIISFDVEGVDLERFRTLFNGVEEAIAESRYQEAKFLVEELKEETDQRRSEALTSFATIKSAQGFIRRYWVLLLVIIIVLGAGGFFSYKTINRKRLEKRIKNMKNETIILRDLTKKAQIERFKKKTISAMVYDIKIKKYEARLNKIKQELPVLENRLIQEKWIKDEKKADK